VLAVDEAVLVAFVRRGARCVVANASAAPDDVEVVSSVQTSPSSQSKRYWCDDRRVPAVGDPRPSGPSPAPAGELGEGGMTLPSDPRSVAERARVGANSPVSEMWTT